MSAATRNRTPVICLHSSGSSGRQWGALRDHLEGEYTVIAPDLQGYGAKPVWPRGQLLSLELEASLLECLFRQHDEPVHLVGHSYGAAVAVRLALSHPERVRSLALFEPTLFSVLLSETPRPSGVEEVLAVAHALIPLLEAGDTWGAARRFVTYWGGEPAWGRLSEGQRQRLVQRAHKAPADFHALFHAGIDRAALGTLSVPVLCLFGMETRLPARLVAQRLGGAAPDIELLRLPGMGHMGPVTHPAIINALIGEFLRRHEQRVRPGIRIRTEEERPHHRAIPGLTLAPGAA